MIITSAPANINPINKKEVSYSHPWSELCIHIFQAKIAINTMRVKLTETCKLFVLEAVKSADIIVPTPSTEEPAGSAVHIDKIAQITSRFRSGEWFHEERVSTVYCTWLMMGFYETLDHRAKLFASTDTHSSARQSKPYFTREGAVVLACPTRCFLNLRLRSLFLPRFARR